MEEIASWTLKAMEKIKSLVKDRTVAEEMVSGQSASHASVRTRVGISDVHVKLMWECTSGMPTLPQQDGRQKQGNPAPRSADPGYTEADSKRLPNSFSIKKMTPGI